MSELKTVTISRELAQFALNAVEYLALRADDIGYSNEPVAAEFRALLAAPVVERQAEPIYQVRYLGEGGGGWIDVEKGEFNKDSLGISNYQTRTVFTSPPAPGALSMSVKSLPSASIVVDHTCPICGDKSGHRGWVCPKQKIAPVSVAYPSID